MKKIKIKTVITGIALGIFVILSLGGIFYEATYQENQEDQDNNETSVNIVEKSLEKNQIILDPHREKETIPALALEEKVPEIKPSAGKEHEEEQTQAWSDMLMDWPGPGEVIGEYGFGYAETFQDYRFHSGIDIALPHGSEVQAALPGTVERISENPWWGYELVIRHGPDLKTIYKGIKPIKDEAGYQVARGEIIGLVLPQIKYEGTMQPHVHFEIHQSGAAIDPREKLK
ncbi:MAG: peptidoglycan DD-metalloendopeptidase family protein [Dehalobacterium sp.]